MCISLLLKPLHPVMAKLRLKRTTVQRPHTFGIRLLLEYIHLRDATILRQSRTSPLHKPPQPWSRISTLLKKIKNFGNQRKTLIAKIHTKTITFQQKNSFLYKTSKLKLPTKNRSFSVHYTQNPKTREPKRTPTHHRGTLNSTKANSTTLTSRSAAPNKKNVTATETQPEDHPMPITNITKPTPSPLTQGD